MPIIRDTCDYKPFVSIVIPVYNGQDTIRECIESLLSQDYDPECFEVIVIDNNSRDNTAHIIGEYPVKVFFEPKQSVYMARNLGIVHAKGELVALTDADCVADPNWIRNLARHFINRDVVGAAGKIMPFESDSLVATFTGEIQHGTIPLNGEPLAAPTGNVAYRKQSLIDIGNFKDIEVGDIDLAWRIQVLTGGQVIFDQEAITYHKYRTTIKGLYRQFRRYGSNEILLTTLHKGRPYHQRTPKNQLIQMLDQAVALLVYTRAIIYRSITWPFHYSGKKYILWPVFQFVVDGGNLVGKIEGLIVTRLFNKIPDTNNY